MSYERKSAQDQGVYQGPLIPRPPEPDYNAIARMCLRHREGPAKCLEVFERMADHLGLDPRARVRVRHLLAMYNRPYSSTRKDK